MIKIKKFDSLTNGSEIKVDVLYDEQNILLTQNKMELLFGMQIPAINKHLKNIFESAKLVEKSVISILETNVVDGKNYAKKLYNLYEREVVDITICISLMNTFNRLAISMRDE